jgi:hypothetical protein
MATTKGKAPAKRRTPARKTSTEKELQKLGRAVARAANSLQKSGPSAVRRLQIVGCLARRPPWCLPFVKGKARTKVWIEIRSGKKRRA